MGRNIKRSFGKYTIKSYPPGNLMTMSISFPQAFELFNSSPYNEAKEIFSSFITVAVLLFIMAQINISSAPNKAEWVDKLPSYMQYKKFINGKHGLIVSACFGLTIAFGYAMEDLEAHGEEKFEYLSSLALNLAESNTGNSKRLSPNKGNWLPYARGEMVAAKGQFLSCPNTSLTRLNINGSEVVNYGIIECLNNIGFDKETYDKYDINSENIKQIVRNLFLTTNSGIPMNNISYDEPNTVYSKIENEIFGSDICRIPKMNFQLEKGMEPSNVLSRYSLKKYLTPQELFAYDIAVRTGDTYLPKKFSILAQTRSKEKATS